MEPSGEAGMSQRTSVLLSEQLEGTMLSPDHFAPVQLRITGGQGGSGGQGHSDGTGGRGGDGLGPTLNITAQAFNLHTVASSEPVSPESQQRKIREAQIGVKCPLPSRKFQGRGNILDSMHDFFSSGPGNQKIYLLHGLGDAGKTQIALKFIKDSLSHFLEIFFVDTSTITTLTTGFKNIAVIKHFGDSHQDGLLWLASNVAEWLLVLDNADDPSINLHDWIPECDHGNIIITTRNPGLSLHAGSHTLVSDMEEADAVALLPKTAGQKATVHTEQIAAEIVKVLYYLPLAIVQAGAFILKSQNLGSYLDLYKANQTQLLREKPTQTNDRYSWTVYTTWELSFKQLSPQAAMLLQLCSFLHYNGITEEIFCYASRYRVGPSGPSEEELQETLKSLSQFVGPTGEWDSLQFTFSMNEIQAYSLINFDEETKLFSIHPLVHAWGQATMDNPENQMLTMGNMLGMAISVRPSWDRTLPSLVLVPHVELAVQSDIHLSLVFREHYGCFFSEAGKYRQSASILEVVLGEYKQILGEDHPNTIGIMNNLGNIYQHLGDYQNAKDLRVSVLEKWKKILGEAHPHTIGAMGNLGNIYRHLGDYHNAKDLEVSVLEKRKKILGEDHLDTISAMGNVGITHWQLGDYQNAKDLGVSVLEKRKQVLGEDHPGTISAMASLGITYEQLGDYQNAKYLGLSVLEKSKQILGEDHPDMISVMNNLGNTYRHLGDYQNAKDLQVSVLEKWKEILGEDHPHTISAMGNLGNTYGQLGDYQNAKDLEVPVLEKRKKILGEDHLDTISAMGNLGITHRQLGDYQKAKDLGVYVLEKRKQILGEDHPDTISAMASLGITYEQLGDYQNAKYLGVSVLEKSKQILGEDHPATIRAMNNLGSTYKQLGDYQNAKDLQVSVLEKHKQILGEDHPHTIGAIYNLGITYGQLGDYQNAKDLQVSVLEKYKQILGEDHPHTIGTIYNLGITYGQLGDYQNAKDLQVSVLEKYKQILGEDHPHTIGAMYNLGITYQQLGDYQNAKDLQVSVLEKRKQILGEDHLHTITAMGNLGITYWQLGDYQNAKDLGVSVLEKCKQILGEDHPNTIAAMSNLRITCSALEKYQKAKGLEDIVKESKGARRSRVSTQSPNPILRGILPGLLSRPHTGQIILRNLIPESDISIVSQPVISALMDKIHNKSSDKIESDID
ncbi:TPR-like protein [Mycena sanguinolenta]|uniref:TPR-like protein n=1 Tax=Mycena sanguinolenta TaxID=230812 RepID=A0A8H6YM69_9AGAR|nr:TPR-like protein [Mycena sanguinolenta]